MRYGELKNVFDAIENALNQLSIDYYLIGALARQIWYDKAKLNYRTTKDVDYAVLVGSLEQYQALKEFLIQHSGFVTGTQNQFVLISPEKFQIDLLPFGKIESAGEVVIERSGMSSIKVDGMQEVYQSGAEIVRLETGHTFKAATLPGIVLLKLISYDDREELRQKDAQDIGNILDNFFELHENEIYSHHLDLFEDELNLENISAIVLGPEIGRIAFPNKKLIERLTQILNDHCEHAENSAFVRLIATEIDKDIELITNSLKDVAWGIQNPTKLLPNSDHEGESMST